MGEAAAPGTGTTLLQALMRERHLTREETIKRLERRAREMHEGDFALSLRQFDRWLAGGVTTAPRPSTCRVVEAEFGRAIEDLLGPEGSMSRLGRRTAAFSASADRALRTAEFVAWIAEHSEASFEDVYVAVAEETDRLAAEPAATTAARVHRAGSVARSQIADAVAGYYRSDSLYRARIGPLELHLSIMTEPDWLGLAAPLASPDRCSWSLERVATPPVRLDPAGTRAAITRLALAETSGTVMVNNPLYRLVAVNIRDSRMHASFVLSDFATYALTADLLEGELVDSIVAGGRPQALREQYLPNLASALSFGDRMCAGGPVCLVALARDAGDYALVVQDRASDVLNVAGRLAVIPKAFHQPIADAWAEVSIGTTLDRELEEELLGRDDLESLVLGSHRKVAPNHPSNLSDAMSWLRRNQRAYRVECTGFGVNLVTGNYEFACLIVVEDPTWWSNYAHRVEANWEAQRLRCVSSRDSEGLIELAGDPRWSNEGLFAFLEGLRRLTVLDPERVPNTPIQAPLP